MTRTIHFGTLVYNYQALDVIGPFDLLHCASRELMDELKGFWPIAEATVARAPRIVFHYIGETMDPIKISNSIPTQPTTTVDECPELDCLLLGGPMALDFTLSPKYADFIRQHVEKGKLLFTNCTGSILAADAGVLVGKNATINNLAFHAIKQKHPDVKWTKEKKWVVDGNIWTAGAAIAGMDMFSYWLKEEFGLDVLTEGTKALDFEPRDIDGVQNVLPKRFDAEGKQLFTHYFE